MKQATIVSIILATLLMFCPAPVMAAFPVHTGKTAINNPAHKAFPQKPFAAGLHAFKALTFSPDEGKLKPGWHGIAALVCSIVALPFYAAASVGLFWLFVLFAVGGLIFGAIGLNRRKYRNSGLAIAGFVLSLIEVVFVLTLMVVIAAFLV